jgi:hypothetical protein
LWKGKEWLSFSRLSLASVTGQMKAVLVIQILATVSARLFVPAALPSVHTARPASPLLAAPRVAPSVLKIPGEVRAPSWTVQLIAVLTAGFISAAAPTITHASVEPLGVVQQYGSSMIAGTGGDDLTERQKEFLAQREELRQKYDNDIESSFKPVEEVRDKKDVYTTIVVGLIAIAFIAPMLQFFYYTGGD